MERIGVIYKWTNKVNGKSYIGQTVSESGRRRGHLTSKYKTPFHCALKKYGVENFDYTVLEYVNESKLSEREIYWIKYYDTYNTGYNLTEGGEGTRGFHYKMSEETKRKLSESKKRNPHIPWNKGKHGVYSEETLRKIGTVNREGRMTEEARKKISEAIKGRPSPMKGAKLSDETKKKISESVKISFEKNNVGEKLSKALKGKPSKRKGKHYGTNKIHSEVMKNKVHVNNGIVSKMINKECLDEYLNNGWVRGRIMKNTKDNCQGA